MQKAKEREEKKGEKIEEKKVRRLFNEADGKI